VNNVVHLLWFVQERSEGEADELLIGVYATETEAEAAIKRLKDKPGFVQEGFKVHAYELGRDHWTEGFIRD
jgi:hypothetical protein